MPGICGIISRNHSATTASTVDLMVQALRSEPCHLTGSWSAPEEGVFVGWVTRQQSFSDCMPVWNEKRDCLLVLYGQHAFDKEDIVALKTRGHQVKRPDAGALIHLYEDKGIDFVKELNGSFSGFILDRRNHQAFLFVDGLGASRLYLDESSECLMFSSDVRGLFAAKPDLGALREESLREYLTLGAVASPGTLFEGIRLMPPGGVREFAGGVASVVRDLSPRLAWENQTLLGEGFFYRRAQEVFERVLPRYLRSDFPMTLALTGGMISRLLITSTELPKGKVPCHTFGTGDGTSEDVALARQLAALVSQQHYEFSLGPDLASSFPALASEAVLASGGAMEVRDAVALHFQRQVRTLAPISISGSLGSELLRGGSGQALGFAAEGCLAHSALLSFDERRARLESDRGCIGPSGLLFTSLPSRLSGHLAAEQIHVEQRLPFLDREFLATLYRAPEGAIHGDRMLIRWLGGRTGELLQIPTDHGPLPQSGVAHHAAARTVLGWMLALKQRFNDRMPTWACALDSPDLDRHLRTYRGFNARVFFRGPLREHVRAVLLDSVTLGRSHVNAAGLEKLVEQHMVGSHDHSVEISRLLTLEILRRAVPAAVRSASPPHAPVLSY